MEIEIACKNLAFEVSVRVLNTYVYQITNEVFPGFVIRRISFQGLTLPKPKLSNPTVKLHIGTAM